MSTKVEIPKLDWVERYKRIMDAAWNSMFADEDWVYRNVKKEDFVRYLQETRPRWSGVVGKKLIEKCGIKPDIEGAVKLLGLYSQEVWGFGDTQYFEARLDSPARGVFANLVCRGWEKEREHSKKIHCDVACGFEYGGVIAALSPKIKVTLTKAFPRGDDRCEYTLEMR